MEGLLSLTTAQKWVFSCRYMYVIEMNYVTLGDELHVIVFPPLRTCETIPENEKFKNENEKSENKQFGSHL